MSDVCKTCSGWRCFM